jgi:hypothetical protein
MHIERIMLRDVGPFDDVPRRRVLADRTERHGQEHLLYALASLVAGGNKQLLGSDLLAARMHSSRSMVAFKSIDERTFVAGSPDLFDSSPPSNPFGNNPLLFFKGGSPAEISARLGESVVRFESRRIS